MYYKTCNRCCSRKKEYKEATREKIKQYNENNKEGIAGQHKEYRERNKETIAQRAKTYRQEHKEHIAEQNKEHREKQKEDRAERGREYRAKNKDNIQKNRRRFYNYTLPTEVANPQELKVCSACKKPQTLWYFPLNSKGESRHECICCIVNMKAEAERQKRLVICECGTTYSKYKKRTHLHGRHHLAWLASNADAGPTNEPTTTITDTPATPSAATGTATH